MPTYEADRERRRQDREEAAAALAAQGATELEWVSVHLRRALERYGQTVGALAEMAELDSKTMRAQPAEKTR